MPMTSRKKRGKGSVDQEPQETPSQIAGLFLAIIGGAGVFLLAVSPWGWLDAIPKVLGILGCAVMVITGRILLRPPGKRGLAMERLASLFRELARAVRGLMARNRDLEEVY